MIAIRVVSCAAVAALVGCSTNNATSPPIDALVQVPPPSSQASFSAAIDAVHASADPVESRWLDSFDDAIAAIAREAIATNWDVRAAFERLEQARLLANCAGVALRPIVDGVIGADWGDPGRNASPNNAFRLGVAASWELDAWGRIWSARSAAEVEAVGASEDFRAVRQAVAAQAAQAWVVLNSALQQAGVLEELIVARERTLSVAAAREKAGVIQKIDVNVATSDVADAKAQLADARRAIADASRSLELLLGRYPDAAIQGSGSLPTLATVVPIGVPSSLLERRPDVIAAERRVAAAFFRVEEAKAAKLPRIALTGELGTASDDLGQVLDPRSVFWNLGANLIAPLFDGGQRDIDIAIATSQQREAIAAYVSTALVAFGEVEAALSAETALARRQELVEQSARDLETARDAAELRYRNGLLSNFELTQVEERLFGARQQLVAIRAARVTQRIALHLALGGDFGDAL